MMIKMSRNCHQFLQDQFARKKNQKSKAEDAATLR